MARATILEYLDNFRRHAGRVGVRASPRLPRAALDLRRRAGRPPIALRASWKRAASARTTRSCCGARTARNGSRPSSAACCAARSSFLSTRLPRLTLPHAWRSRSTPSSASARHTTSSRALPRFDLEQLRESISRHTPTTPVEPPALTRDDIVEIVFTSGTTAEPRGVVISHGNILANLEPLEREIGKYLQYERIFHPLRFLNLLPLSHVFGQFLGIFLPQLLAGDGDLPGHAEPDGGHARDPRASAYRWWSPCRA